MSDYIKREDAIKIINDSVLDYVDCLSTVKKLEEIPTADVVGRDQANKVVAHINIDTDELIERIKNEYEIEERKRGEWIEYPDCLKWKDAYMPEHFVCSECKAVFNALDNEGDIFLFCPNCGADMRGVERITTTDCGWK